MVRYPEESGSGWLGVFSSFSFEAIGDPTGLNA